MNNIDEFWQVYIHVVVSIRIVSLLVRSGLYQLYHVYSIEIDTDRIVCLVFSHLRIFIKQIMAQNNYTCIWLYCFRELQEECSLTATRIQPVGLLMFEFKGDPQLLEVHVFSTDTYTGTPTESDGRLLLSYMTNEHELHYLPLQNCIIFKLLVNFITYTVRLLICV